MTCIKSYGKHIRRRHKWARHWSVRQFNIAAVVHTLVQLISYEAQETPDLSFPVDSGCPTCHDGGGQLGQGKRASMGGWRPLAS